MKKYYFLLIVLIAFAASSIGQTTLSAGDLAIYGVNADNPDDFGFVLLADIESGTEIRFTDSGWKSDNTFRGGEGAVKYTAPSDLSAGTEITYQGDATDFVADNDATVGTNGFNLSASGDQVFAFQGASTSPTFIFAVQTNSNQWQADATASTNSAIPQGLTDGVNAAAVGAGPGAGDEYDNAAYDKSTMSGTVAVLLAAISNNSNWDGDNANRFDLTDYDFTISGSSSTPSVSTVDATSIGETVADMNGNVTSDGGETVTDRGVCYKTSPGVTLSDNLTTAGSGGTGTYSVNFTTLTAETHYYFAAYATNSVGTSLASNELDFWTLSTEPTGHSTTFTATTISYSQIDLAFDAASTLGADGYIVLRREDGSDPDATGVTDATAPNSLSLPSGTSLVTTITDNSVTSHSDQGLTSVTQYNYAILPYNYNGANDETYNYKTDGTIPTDNATTSVKPEPTNHVSSFAAGTPGSSSIPLTWNDNDGATPADGFLIKASTSNTFTDPNDGTPEVDDTDMTDGSGQINVAHGVQAYTFTGLNENTEYFFKIWPYTNSGSDIDYKTDGTVPTANETTSTANTDLIISEVVDPDDVYQARFVELYNLSATEIDFDGTEDWYIVKQVNGGTQYDTKLTGSVAAGSTFVIVGNQTDFNTAYGFDPDQTSSQITGNGDDGYYLYFGGDENTGTLIDAYGVIGEDGSGKDWEYLDTKAIRLRSVIEPTGTWTAAEWDIPGSATVADMTPSEYREDVSWQATATGTDWNTKSTDNWGGTYGYIPDASFDVTIVDASPNNPQIGAESACNDLTLNSDAALSVGPGIPLTVYGDLSIAASKSRGAASFVVDAGTTNNGSVIIHGSVTGEAVVMRYFEGYDDGAVNGWHLIGSPVNNMLISGSDFDVSGSADDLYQWDEPSSMWENYKKGHFTNFENGKGYLSAFETSDYRSFTGTLNNTDVPVTNLSKDIDGWHIIGNPFPSAIEWNNGGWALTNIADVAKKYEESSGNYLDLAAGAIVPSTNGFFVQATAGGAGVTIPKSARVHSSADNFKKSRVETFKETLVFKITNDENIYYDLTRVGFKPEATEAWDPDFDSHKLFGASTAPQLWTVTDGDIFSWNNLPYVYESYQVPLHFRAGVNSTYHINAEGIESFYDNSGIYLEDLFTNELINLGEQQLYTFTATTEDDEARFILHFSMVTSIGDVPELVDNVSIYAHSNSIYIRFSEMPESDFRVEVFNAIGQQVFAGEMEASTLSNVRLYQKPGFYIVRLKTADKFIVKKVILK